MLEYNIQFNSTHYSLPFFIFCLRFSNQRKQTQQTISPTRTRHTQPQGNPHSIHAHSQTRQDNQNRQIRQSQLPILVVPGHDRAPELLLSPVVTENHTPMSGGLSCAAGKKENTPKVMAPQTLTSISDTLLEPGKLAGFLEPQVAELAKKRTASHAISDFSRVCEKEKVKRKPPAQRRT